MTILSPQTPKSPYSLRNHNHFPNAADDYFVSLGDTASPDSLIDSKLKRKMDPRSMIKQKKTVTGVDAADKNASHDTINTAPHSPNATTAPDAKNKTSVRQLLDGQEYPVAKGDIIKKGFYREAYVD